jgi:hypothetical protein
MSLIERTRPVMPMTVCVPISAARVTTVAGVLSAPDRPSVSVAAGQQGGHLPAAAEMALTVASIRVESSSSAASDLPVDREMPTAAPRRIRRHKKISYRTPVRT